jgi:hypothetical protein
LSSLHSGWLISHPCPSEVDTTNFMLSLLLLTSSSILFLPVRSISLSRGRGISIAKGTFLRIISATLMGSLSAYGADIRKSTFADVVPMVLLIGFVSFSKLGVITLL